MSSNHTSNIGLCQWLSSDEFKREDFNADNAAIDQAIGSRAGIITGSYSGTGTYGSTNPNTLSFSHVPKAVFICSSSGTTTGACLIIWGCAAPLMHTVNNSNSALFALSATYSGSRLSWYYSGSATGAVCQLNSSGVTYKYVALY